MRGSPPARPRAISIAAPIPWVGTSPRRRAANESRQPATSTWPSRPSAGWQAAHSANGRSGWHARPSRYAAIARASVNGGGFRLRHVLGLARSDGQRLEEDAVRLLRRMRKTTREAVEQDHRAALDEREPVAPEPQGMSEREVGDERRVRRLAREVRASCAGLRRRSRPAGPRAGRPSIRRHAEAPLRARQPAALNRPQRPRARSAGCAGRGVARSPEAG